MKPFTPAEALANKTNIIPDYVIQAFNNMLSRNYVGGKTRVCIKQKDVIEEIIQLAREIVTNDVYDDQIKDKIFKNHWLDVESIYEANGWNVTYDKPGFNETYDAYFIFVAK